MSNARMATTRSRSSWVRDVVQGASCACAEVFGATDDVRSCGVTTVNDNAVPGTAGLLSLRRYLADGWNLVVF
jgi:hypothetical protein